MPPERFIFITTSIILITGSWNYWKIINIIAKFFFIVKFGFHNLNYLEKNKTYEDKTSPMFQIISIKNFRTS